MASADASLPDQTGSIAVRSVSVDQSSAWLRLGWRDMWTYPGLSLGYGALFAVLGYVVFFGLEQVGLGSLALPALSGFLLIAPVAATGLYEISRRIETGEPISLKFAFNGFCTRCRRISNMGVVLLLMFFVWIQVAFLIFALFYTGSPPPLGNFAEDVLFSLDSLPFLAAGTLAGGAIAAIAFSVSVIALPMLIDRDVGVVEAMMTSLRAVRANIPVMVGWAAALALITFAGMAMFLVGMAIALPLLGHASWHAYRAMVEPPPAV